MASPILQFKRGAVANLPGLRAGEPALTTDTFDLYVGIDSSVNNNKFFGSHRYWTKETSSTGSGIRFVERTDGGSNYIELKAPDSALGGNVTYVLPGTQGATSSVLTNDGSGNLTWASGSANPTFSGIATFTDTTDNTLGNANTGSVQIDGGVGINKNLTVGGNLNVQGYSEFVGVVTFTGGTINLGDSDTDDINVAGEFISNLVPNTDNTYDIGDGANTKRWRNASFSGLGTFASGARGGNVQIGVTGANIIDTSSGNLTINSAGGATIIDDAVTIQNNLTVNGNVTIGGTTVTLTGQDVFIENKDLVLGYTTSTSPNDTTANHGGIAIASTEGTPLVNFEASGINTLPSTYKQLMWFKSGTLGFSTDAFAFNYGVAIGTTTMADGVRLAVGTGVTVGDDSITASNFYGTFNGSITGNAPSADQVKTVSAADNPANYYVTFVDSNNGSATNETVYTDDGIYYNPGTNTFTTQNAYFTGNITVDGTLTGTASTASRATTVDTTGTSANADYYVTFADTLAGQTSETLRVGVGLSVNPSDGSVKTHGILSVGNPAALTSYIKAGGGSNALYLYADGQVSFQNKAIVNEIRSASNASTLITLSDLDATFARNVVISGITTIGTGVGVTQFSGSVSSGTSESSVPTSKAVIDYVTSQVSSIDVTLGLNADSGGPSTVSTSETLTISGTANEVETSVSGQTVTIGLPNDVIVGTSLSAPTIKTATIQHQNGTSAVTIDTLGNVTASQNLTVTGNLYVNGSTTQVDTASLTVEDRTIQLGMVDGAAPTGATTWDLGVLFNYFTDSAKQSGVVWEHAAARFQFGSVVADSGGTGPSNPQLTVSTFAPIEIGGLWVNDCAGQSQVISCTGTERNLENITIDAGTF